MTNLNRLLILPFHERWAARERIKKGQPLFGGFALSAAASDPGAWQAKPLPIAENATASAFKLLGLTQTATQEDVKRRYRELAFEHHPDRGGDIKKFHAISAAKDLCTKALKA